MGQICGKSKKAKANRSGDPQTLYLDPNTNQPTSFPNPDGSTNQTYFQKQDQFSQSDPTQHQWQSDVNEQGKPGLSKSPTLTSAGQGKKGKGADTAEKNKLGYFGTSSAQSGVFDDFGHPINIANLFEVSYIEKNTEPDDFYLDMGDPQWRQLEQFHEQNQNQQSSFSQGQDYSAGGSKSHSAAMEWSKLLQKLFTIEKTSISLNENKNKLLKAYKSMLNLKERNWYEELTGLYKERNMMSKATSSMTGLTFDRKLIQLQEQFRWFVSAVGNVKLNFNNLVGVHEFPPFKSSSKGKRGSAGEKIDSSSASLGGGKAGSVTDSDDGNSQSPNKVQMMQSSIPKKSQSVFVNARSIPQDPKTNVERELPDIFSPVWQVGFVWKGVFFKLYSKKYAKKIKKEMRVLRHIAVECLQTETSFRMDAPSQPSPTDGSSHAVFVNIILPLMCTVEGSSWVLLGTPVFPIKRTVQDDWISKLASDASGLFKNSFLLTGLSPRNFKIFFKAEEQGNQNMMGGHGPTNHFLMLSNVGKIALPMPKVDVMFSLNQESNAHVTFLEYPKRGLIDPELIRRVLGYGKFDISTAVLLRKDPRNDNKAYFFDLVKFRRRGWLVQIVYVSGKDSHPPNFTRNRRAIDLMSHSEKLRGKEIRGNVLVFATLMNRESIIHPYFLSDCILGQGLIEPETSDNSNKNQKNKNVDPNLSKNIFKINRITRDDRKFGEYLIPNLNKSLDYILEYLNNTDNVINFASLKELFHRKGVNMRFEWLIFIKLKNERAKALVGADILARVIKKMFDDKTSRKLSRYKKLAPQNYFEATAMKEKFDELLHDKNEFLLENFYKRLLCQTLNILIKGQPDVNQCKTSIISLDSRRRRLFLHRTKH